eukprot:2504600-Prymnesium_polylepis.2
MCPPATRRGTFSRPYVGRDPRAQGAGSGRKGHVCMGPGASGRTREPCDVPLARTPCPSHTCRTHVWAHS